MSLSAATDVSAIRWHDVDGYRLDLLTSCAGFLVRWSADGRSRGELVINEDTGGPLVLPVRITPPELCARLGDRVGYYLLSPVDAECRRVDAPDGAIWLTPSMVARAARWRSAVEATAAMMKTLAPLVERWLVECWSPPPPVRTKGGAS